MQHSITADTISRPLKFHKLKASTHKQAHEGVKLLLWTVFALCTKCQQYVGRYYKIKQPLQRSLMSMLIMNSLIFICVNEHFLRNYCIVLHLHTL